MLKTLVEIKKCTICSLHLEHSPRPVMAASPFSKIVIIGQAPGRKVHESGIPWQDVSGNNLRKWMGIDDETFYNPDKVALIPMGFCYPGKGKSGDLPPRKECAPQWHETLLKMMPDVKLTLLIGQYAQAYYLKEKARRNLTETVRHYKTLLPGIFPLPHPSPRNNIWQRKNPWFAEELLPELQKSIQGVLK